MKKLISILLLIFGCILQAQTKQTRFKTAKSIKVTKVLKQYKKKSKGDVDRKQQPGNVNEDIVASKPVECSKVRSFDLIEQSMRQHFGQHILPKIKEQFTAMNAQRSSAFVQAVKRAEEQFETEIAVLRADFLKKL